MALDNQISDREYKKFKISTSAPTQTGIVVVNPDGSDVFNPAVGQDVNVRDGSGTSITSSVVGADTGLDVNILNDPDGPRTITLNTDTGTGNISVNLALAAVIKILGVKIHFASVPTANDFVVTSGNLAGGPAFDTVLYKANPGTLGVTDLLWVPAGEVLLTADETLTVTFTNTGATQYGLTITYEQGLQ